MRALFPSFHSVFVVFWSSVSSSFVRYHSVVLANGIFNFTYFFSIHFTSKFAWLLLPFAHTDDIYLVISFISYLIWNSVVCVFFVWLLFFVDVVCLLSLVQRVFVLWFHFIHIGFWIVKFVRWFFSCGFSKTEHTNMRSLDFDHDFDWGR